jgi:hypothetical protein
VPARIRRRLPLVLALVFSSILLLSALSSSGLGEPYELDAADRARRFAAEVLGARALALEGEPPAAPPEVAGGPLPVAAVGLAFRVLGLSVWAGRLPMAVAALAGVAAVAFLLARLFDRRAAAYGAAALVTMPLFFVEARTMLGDAMTMGATAVAFGGLGVAVFDRRRDGRRDRGSRLAALAIGTLALAAGGLSRGALLGVGAPALGVGMAWVLLGRRREAVADLAGVLALSAGGVAFAIGAREVAGSAAHPAFDAVFHRVGHAIFPWSGLLPVAFVALLSGPARRGAWAAAREEAGRALVLAGSVSAFAAHALGHAGRDTLPFTSPAVLAAAVAIAARDLDRRGGEGLRDVSAARAGGVAAAVLTALIARDLIDAPDRALASIVPLRAGASLASGGGWVRVAAIVAGGVLALAAFDRPRAARAASMADAYLAWPRALARVFGGKLLVGLAAVEAALVSLGLTLALRPARAAALGELPRLVGRHGFWVLPIAVIAAVWGPLLLRDTLHGLRRRLGLPRGGTVIVGAAAAGAMLAFGHYPAILGHLSPREALARFAALRGPGEPIGALGVSARAATLEVGASVRPFADARSAAAFLAPGAVRSWLVLRRDDLPSLNALVRAREGRNVAVLAGGEGGALLVASERRPGDPTAEGSLDDLVLSTPPPVANPVEVSFGEALLGLGWDLRDSAGSPVDAVMPLHAYRLRLYYRVKGKVEENLCSFVHVDGQGRRFNGEHRDFTRYPIRYWQPGDVIVDEYEVNLGGHFTPGAYALRYGFDHLPCDGHARLPVQGPHDGDHRVIGGNLHVR